MTLFHASFKGRKNSEVLKPLRKIEVLLSADSIYDVPLILDKRYDFISGLCTTNCDAADISVFEIRS